jgi:TonB family protein
MGSPTLVGTAVISIDGHPTKCEVIRGPYTPNPSGEHLGQLEVCVDPVSKLILRYKFDSNSRIQTWTFSSIQRNAELDADLIQFRAPEGSRALAVINWREPGLQPEDPSVFIVSNDVAAPRMISIVPPDSPVPIPEKPPEGAVLLTGEIDAEGAPRKLKVSRSLGDRADSEAVKAVNKWRFLPAQKGSKPVPVVAAIAVFFHAQ